MSVKMSCDGCGKDLVREQVGLLQVATHNGKLESTLERYELCASCLTTAQMYFNPTIWPRSVRKNSALA